MVEEKRVETMLVYTSMEEAEELLNFMNILNPYEKREFMGIMKGAKLVKKWQTVNNEAAVV